MNKLLDHFNTERNEVNLQTDRKLELLKQEANKYKHELQNLKNNQDRQCLCKYYEETLAKLKDEHQ